MHVGNETNVQTRICLVDKEKLAQESKARDLTALREKVMQEAVVPVQKQLVAKAAILKKAGAAVTERQKAEMKKWVDQYTAGTSKLGYIDKKIAEIRENLQKATTMNGFIRISGDAYPGTQIDLYGIAKSIKSTVTNKRFVIKDFAVDTEG